MDSCDPRQEHNEYDPIDSRVCHLRSHRVGRSFFALGRAGNATNKCDALGDFPHL